MQKLFANKMHGTSYWSVYLWKTPQRYKYSFYLCRLLSAKQSFGIPVCFSWDKCLKLYLLGQSICYESPVMGVANDPPERCLSFMFSSKVCARNRAKILKLVCLCSASFHFPSRALSKPSPVGCRFCVSSTPKGAGTLYTVNFSWLLMLLHYYLENAFLSKLPLDLQKLHTCTFVKSFPIKALAELEKVGFRKERRSWGANVFHSVPQFKVYEKANFKRMAKIPDS